MGPGALPPASPRPPLVTVVLVQHRHPLLVYKVKNKMLCIPRREENQMAWAASAVGARLYPQGQAGGFSWRFRGSSAKPVPTSFSSSSSAAALATSVSELVRFILPPLEGTPHDLVRTVGLYSEPQGGNASTSLHYPSQFSGHQLIPGSGERVKNQEAEPRILALLTSALYDSVTRGKMGDGILIYPT